MFQNLLNQRPWRLSAMAALAYVLLSVTINSGFHWLAEMQLTTVAEWHIFDRYKDYTLILLTGGGLYGLSYLLFRRLCHSTSALVTAERKAMAGTFGLAVIHDINNMLTIADQQAQLLQRNLTALDEKTYRQFNTLTASLQRLMQTTRRINEAGKNAMGTQFRREELSALVHATVEMAKGHHRLRQCQVKLISGSSLDTLCHPGLVQDAVLNLMLNAADATENKGAVQVRLMPEGDYAVVEVHDNGPGISPAHRERIFEAFHTTKSHGTGLGLLSVRACADAHSGTVEALDSPLGGALIRLRMSLRLGTSSQVSGKASSKP